MTDNYDRTRPKSLLTRFRGSQFKPLRRAVKVPVWGDLGIRLGLALRLIFMVVLIHWLDHDGLVDNLDGEVSFLDVIYFTMISITTTGFGDIAPVSDRARLVEAVIVTPVRFAVLFIFVGTAYNFIIKRSWEKWRMARIQGKLSDHIVVLGYGVSGSESVAELIERGTDPQSIVVVDPSEERISEAEALGCNVIAADAARDSTLEAVRIREAQTVLVSAGRDDTSILIVLTVRHLAPDVPISVVVRADDNEFLARQAGANNVINPVRFTGLLLAGSARGAGVGAPAMATIPDQKKVGMVSLGCPKALVDSERILTKLRADGYAMSPDYAGADVVLVNTCGFLDSAKEESLSAIGEAIAENGRVIVTGCMGEEADVIRAKFPQVLAVTGAHQYEQVVEAVHEAAPPSQGPYIDLTPQIDVKLTPRHYSYLKISEGCNHSCAFCIIPQLRGKLVSRRVDAVLREAEKLVAAGTRELLVISQDTSAYGVDIRHEERVWKDHPVRAHMTDLARELGQLKTPEGEQPWVRLHYVYPYPHVDAVIPLMAEGFLTPYLDIPFQHASPSVLKAMKRPANEAKVLERLKSWREICPDIAIRSSFVVGFPGETEEDFRYLLDWLEEAQLDRVGAFRFEPVEGAPANALPNAVPEEVKEERNARVMEVTERISADKLSRKVGATIAVIIDEVGEPDEDGDIGATGRSQADAPEIDGAVYLRNVPETLEQGDIVQVKVEDSDAHDLFGVVA